MNPAIPETMIQIATPMPIEKPMIALSPIVGLLRDAALCEILGGDGRAVVDSEVELREVVVALACGAVSYEEKDASVVDETGYVRSAVVVDVVVPEAPVDLVEVGKLVVRRVEVSVTVPDESVAAVEGVSSVPSDSFAYQHFKAEK